jgi:predicted CoA-binding protein
MTDPREIMREAKHVVVQDYPSHDVPDALTRAGMQVTIYGGPDEADVVSSELQGDKIVHRKVGRYPDRADLYYTYRPLAEIDKIIAEAQRLGATTLWRQPPNDTDDDPDPEVWRAHAEAAGLTYVDSPPIDEVARELPPS